MFPIVAPMMLRRLFPVQITVTWSGCPGLWFLTIQSTSFSPASRWVSSIMSKEVVSMSA